MLWLHCNLRALLSFYCSPDVVYVRGVCYRSQKKAGAPYTVTISVKLDTDKITTSTCECPAGKGVCSHVLALLQLLIFLQKGGYTEAPPALSCTELPQQWRRPRQAGLKPSTVQTVDWRRVYDGGCNMPKRMKLSALKSQNDDDCSVTSSIRELGENLGALGKTSFSSVLLSSKGPLVPTKYGLAPPGSPATYHQATQPSGYSTLLGNLLPGTDRVCAVPRVELFVGAQEYVFEEQYSNEEKVIFEASISIP